MPEDLSKDIKHKIDKNKEEYKKMKKDKMIDELIEVNQLNKKYQQRIAELEGEIVKSKENQEYYKNQLLRMQADFDNYKKREEKKRSEYYEYASQDLIFRLLSVIDNLERAVTFTDEKNHPVDSLREGILNILKEFLNILEKEGLKPIKSIGEKFDPYCHEAVSQSDSEEYPEDIVMEELKKGYYLKSKVIRPAVVKVSTGYAKKDEIK